MKKKFLLLLTALVLFAAIGGLSVFADGTAAAPPEITAQPAGVVAKAGKYVTFTVKAQGEGLTYQWQISDDQGQTWRNSSLTTPTYGVILSSKNDGRCVRCLVTDENGNSVTSDAASMTICTPKITVQPTDIIAKNGAWITFRLTAAGEGLTYQWQLSDDQGQTWRNSSIKTANYATTLSEKNNGRFVRCLVTDENGNSVTSDAVAMKITALKITTQPVNAKAELGGKVSFHVAAVGEGLTYQWQLSDDQGQTWRNSSIKAADYATTLSEKNNGRYVRCLVTDQYGNSVKSYVATMKTVTLKITAQPTDSEADLGRTVSFKVAAVGTGLTYQWQLSDDQGQTWRNSSLKTACYSVTLSEKNIGRCVRCIVTDQSGRSVTSDTAVMKLADSRKIAYLTFDDGPSENTEKILDILDEYNVKATFFVIYHENRERQYQAIVERGHTIALHSYTHEYETVYADEEAYFDDLTKIHDYVYSVTGVDSRIIRFPGGSSNTVSNKYCQGIMARLKTDVVKQGYTYHDWNVNSTDANGNNRDPALLLKNVQEGLTVSRKVNILMHDTGKTKQTTVEALPSIIEYVRAQGYEMERITEDSKVITHI